MKKRLSFLGSRLLSALRLALGALLFTPVFALLVAVNYGVDCQGYFLGDTYLREIATMLFEGKNFVGFNQLNGVKWSAPAFTTAVPPAGISTMC